MLQVLSQPFHAQLCSSESRVRKSMEQELLRERCCFITTRPSASWPEPVGKSDEVLLVFSSVFVQDCGGGLEAC